MPDAAISRALARATALAARGPQRGGNPRVGCVILAPGGRTVAEGWHRGAGTAHAEADAIARADPADLVGATAVVTLEPCHHDGRTPPCSRALHAAGISRVVYAVADPHPLAAGGAQWLAARGVEVTTAREAGVGEDVVRPAEQLVADWTTTVRRHRPWLVAKTAASLDGRAAAADGTSKWITGTAARAHAHTVRADVDAIVVGTGTVLADDPALSARHPDGTLREHQPLKVVVGHRPVPERAALRAGTWRHLATHDLAGVLSRLWDAGARRVLLEGGPTLLGAALRAGLVDELHAYLAPVLLGAGRPAVPELGITTLSAAPRWRTTETHHLGEDLLVIARPPEGDDQCSPDLSRRSALSPAAPTLTELAC